VVAPFRVDQHVGAFRALTGHVLGQAVVLHPGLIVGVDVLLQHAGDGVCAGKNGLAPLPRYRGTADAPQLLDHLGHVHAGAQRFRNEAADGFQLGGGAGAGLAQGGEYLKNAFVIVGDGDIQGAAAGGHFGNRPFGFHGPGAAGALESFLRGFIRLLAGGQHLRIPGAVAVDGDTLQPLLVSQHVGMSDVLTGSLVREVNGLGDGVVRGPLESRLHTHVPFRGDFMGGDEDLLYFFRDALDFIQVSALRQLFHQLFRVKAALFRRFFKIRVHLDELGAVEDGLGIAQGEERFDAAGTTGNHA